MNKLTKKLGPLPVWAWLIVIVGGYFAAKYLRANRASAPASAPVPAAEAIDPGSGVGGGAGGGGGTIVPVETGVAGGQPASAQGADYTGLLTTAIDSLSGKQDAEAAVLGSVAETAVAALSDTNAALISRVPTKVSVTVKAPLDKKGDRTKAPHHKQHVETPKKGLRKSAAPPPSHKQTTAAKPHPQAQESVRPAVHHVSTAQGSKKQAHSPAISAIPHDLRPAPKPAPKAKHK